MRYAKASRMAPALNPPILQHLEKKTGRAITRAGKTFPALVGSLYRAADRLPPVAQLSPRFFGRYRSGGTGKDDAFR
jgi:hypothetical protein